MNSLSRALEKAQEFEKGKRIIVECMQQYALLNEQEEPDVDKKEPFPKFDGDLTKDLEARRNAMYTKKNEPILLNTFIQKINSAFVKPMKVDDLSSNKSAGNVLGLIDSFDKYKRSNSRDTSFINSLVISWLNDIQGNVSGRAKKEVESLQQKYETLSKLIYPEWKEFYEQLEGAIPWLFKEKYKDVEIQKALFDELQKIDDQLEKLKQESDKDLEQAMKEFGEESFTATMIPMVVDLIAGMGRLTKIENRAHVQHIENFFKSFDQAVSDGTIGNKFLSWEAKLFPSFKSKQMKRSDINKKLAQQWLDYWNRVYKRMTVSIETYNKQNPDKKVDHKSLFKYPMQGESTILGGTDFSSDMKTFLEKLKEVANTGTLDSVQQKVEEKDLHYDIVEVMKQPLTELSKEINQQVAKVQQQSKNQTYIKDAKSIAKQISNMVTSQTGEADTVLGLVKNFPKGENNDPKVVMEEVKKRITNTLATQAQKLKLMDDTAEIAKTITDFIDKTLKPLKLPEQTQPEQQNESKHVLGRLLNEALLIEREMPNFIKLLESNCRFIEQVYGMSVVDLLPLIMEEEEFQESEQEKLQRIKKFRKTVQPNIQINALQKIFNTKVFSKTGLDKLDGETVINDLHNISHTYISQGNKKNMDLLHSITRQFLVTAAGSKDAEVKEVADALLKKFEETESKVNMQNAAWKGFYDQLEGALTYIYAKATGEGNEKYGEQGSSSDFGRMFEQSKMRFENLGQEFVKKHDFLSSSLMAYSGVFKQLFFSEQYGLGNLSNRTQKIPEEFEKDLIKSYELLDDFFNHGKYTRIYESNISKGRGTKISGYKQTFNVNHQEKTYVQELLTKIRNLLKKYRDDDKVEDLLDSLQTTINGASFLDELDSVVDFINNGNAVPGSLQPLSDEFGYTQMSEEDKKKKEEEAKEKEKKSK